jgi:hypothetical protein
MVDATLPPLQEWETFYVITGSAGGALTGLQFVVIALRPEIIAEAGEGGVRAFATPNVMHFCGVLLVAAVAAIPHQTATSLALCLAGVGIGGLALSTWVAVQARRQSAYQPVLSDWIWHVALPFVVYAAVAFSAGILLRRPAAALDVVGVASLALLFIGIRNAWDSAVWIAAGRRSPRPPR